MREMGDGGGGGEWRGDTWEAGLLRKIRRRKTFEGPFLQPAHPAYGIAHVPLVTELHADAHGVVDICDGCDLQR